ncbi:Aspercryptin biosynthesis cluster-specific transcription regulator atnN [Colletotrichum trifolii]|uniref:Aspercryptin biosynthesis cluster-specific transcription regulator atnN n=1 Tax=Colletotrichum trifolii TaxID=5466 RepID=A0A4V3HUH1_COLTR|nr:Aspercryptin biosynthesis cluster-specific transcription regulator atnN [Colletotrichum trifolii]
MARKGSRKVRTGCITCKIRKVKCDENKPACNRCLTTGRKCDGYQHIAELPPPKSSVSVANNLLHRTFPGVGPSNDHEGRALQYFCETVGPFLSGAVDPYFWTHVVMQFSTFEPSVRHSLVAISSLYEQIEGQEQAGLHPPDQRFALQHYNAAINELKTIKSHDKQPIVLIVCVLFICIEFLQSNREAAVRHCKHGVEILRSICREFSWMEEHLLPLFRRLVELAFFFGEKSDCSDLAGLERPIPPFFSTYHDAQLMIDDLYNRTFQLMKRCDPYRSGPRRGDPVCQGILDDRDQINHLLDVWQELFASFSYRVLYTTVSKTTENDSHYRSKMLRGFLVARYECCRVWLNLALNGDEHGFDQFVNNFKRVAKVLKTMVADVPPHALRRDYARLTPKFVFETGFTPMLFSIVATCRHLETRLQILQLMPLLGLPRENLWDLDTLIAVARRMVEKEHDITLDSFGRPIETPAASWPAKGMRVLDVAVDSNPEVRYVQGRKVTGKLVGFYKRNAEGGLDAHTEFVVINSEPVKEAVEFNSYPSLLYEKQSPGSESGKTPAGEVEEPKVPMKSIAGAYSWDVKYPESP